MERSFFVDFIVPILMPSNATDRFQYFPRRCAADARRPLGAHQSIEVRRAGGARDWNAGCTEPRCANSASVVRYRSSIACGSCSSGGVANRTLLASEMTAQIAQPSVCRSGSGWQMVALRGCCRLRGQRRGDSEIGVGQAGLDCRCGLRDLRRGNARTTAQTGSRAQTAPAASRFSRVFGTTSSGISVPNVIL